MVKIERCIFPPIDKCMFYKLVWHETLQAAETHINNFAKDLLIDINLLGSQVVLNHIHWRKYG
jgi:hypothetical protein